MFFPIVPEYLARDTNGQAYVGGACPECAGSTSGVCAQHIGGDDPLALRFTFVIPEKRR